MQNSTHKIPLPYTAFITDKAAIWSHLLLHEFIMFDRVIQNLITAISSFRFRIPCRIGDNTFEIYICINNQTFIIYYVCL